MLLVRTILKPSPIQGLGLFALEPIPKGAVTWRFSASFDLLFAADEVERMPPLPHELIKRHGYLSLALHKYVYCSDDARFLNHSPHCNNDQVLLPGDVEPANVANRDIAAGEELTVDYRTFDAVDAESGEAWLHE